MIIAEDWDYGIGDPVRRIDVPDQRPEYIPEKEPTKTPQKEPA